MQLIAITSDWENEKDAIRAQLDMQNWLDSLSPTDSKLLHQEIVSDDADWEKGMMSKALEESDRITSEIFTNYVRTPSTGHSLSVIAK